MNSFTPNDAHLLLEEICKEATGRDDISVVDTSSFTSVAEITLRTGYENTLGAISNVIAKTIFSVRPYKQKLSSLLVSPERYGAQVRKIVNLFSETEASKDWNTAQNTTTLDDGNSVDMFTINKPKVMQLNIIGTQVLAKSITIFRDQLSQAFSSESELTRFIDAIMVEFYNEIELINEQKSRATLINAMAGVSSMGLTEVDLVAEYNTKYNQTYTRAQLLSTYLDSFMKFVAAEIKKYSSYLTDMTTKYHANITGYAPIMRHVPKERQKMVMYEPIFIDAESNVYSTLFNPEYLNIGTFEGVNFWQSANDPTQIKCKPNILDVTTGASKTAETDVELPWVLGFLHDEEALGIVPQFDYASTTPFNSKGGYWNQFMHWRFNSYVDYTEDMVLFVLGAGGE